MLKHLPNIRIEDATLRSKQDITTKPYYKCFICPRFRNTCGGRPTRDMTLTEWCEYMRDTRDFFGLTNDYITRKAESSAGTTERIMAANSTQDIMRATARRYEQAIIGPVGEFTCYLDNDPAATAELIRQLREEVEYWKAENDRKAKIIDRYLADS